MGTIALKLLVACLYAWIYAVGGRAAGPGKWVRRWVGSPIMIGALYGFSALADTLSTERALAIPLFFGTAIFGYGGKTLIRKFLRRLLFGSCFALYAIIIGHLYSTMMLGIAQAILALFASLFFGLLNPDKAAEEETEIAILSVVLLPFIVS